MIGGHERILIDTAPLIYLLAADEPRGGYVRSVLEDAMRGRFNLWLSQITVAELLVRPLREGDEGAARAARSLVDDAARFSTVDVDRRVAEEAAGLRAATRLGLPDALVAASAVVAGCTALLGNDAGFHRLGERVAYLHLDDLAGEPA